MKPLSEILRDGHIVDNSVHTVSEKVFQAGRNGERISIYHGNGWNNPHYTEPILRKAHALRVDAASLVKLNSETDYSHNTSDFLVLLQGFPPGDFTLTTGNVIGWLKEGDYELRISSRFGDDFLRFIVADTDGFVELADSGGISHNSSGYEWLLVHVWRTKLKKAMRLGLPKSYESRTESLVQVRGRLDPVDYSINNRRGVYSCTFREHSYNNPATRLIARTLDHLDSQSQLSGDHALRQTFLNATAGQRYPLQELLAAEHLRNPYFADYNVVIDLAKRILKGDLLDCGDQNNTSAFFFDVSMLFEQFVRNLFRRCGCRMRETPRREWAIDSGLPGNRRKLIPDLFFEFNDRTFVFDVKYKNFKFTAPGAGVNREDLFQLHTYLGHASNADDVSGCGFVFPVREETWKAQNLEASGGIYQNTITQGGNVFPFLIIFIKIPTSHPANNRALSFHERFRTELEAFKTHFRRTLSSLASNKTQSRSHVSCTSYRLSPII